jgi:hypothetical protein
MPSSPPQRPVEHVSVAGGSDSAAGDGCGSSVGSRTGGKGAGGGSGLVAGATAAAASPSPPLVFLSHAGEQKRHVVDCLHTLLTRTYDVAPVFLDEHTLEPGTHNEPAMRDAVGRAPVGARPTLQQVLPPCLAACM